MRLNRRRCLKMTNIESYFTLREFSWLRICWLIGDCRLDGINQAGDSEREYRKAVKDGN